MNPITECLLRGSLIAATSTLLLLALRKDATKAQSQHLTFIFLALLSLPLILGFGVRWNVLPGPQATTPIPAPTVSISAPPAISTPPTEFSDIVPTVNSAQTTPLKFPWRALLLSLYALGILASLAPSLLSWTKLCRRQRSASPCDDARIHTFAERDANRIYLSAKTLMPMAWGFFRPSILLPHNATTWTDARLKAVLAHERAHIERHDTRMTILVQFTRALYWPQPLVWWLASKWQTAAELDCDRRAIKQGDNAHDYATALYDFAKQHSNPNPLALPMARPQAIEERVKRVLSPNTSTSSNATLSLLLALSSFFILAVVAQEKEASPEPAPAMEELMATDILLNEIILPDLKINNATLQDSVRELINLAKANDTRDVPDDDKGIQIVIAEDEIREHHPEALSSRISLELKDVPLVDAIRYTTGLTGLKFTIEPNIVTIQPKQSTEGTLFTRHYFLAVPLRATNAQDFLTERGIQFDGEATAHYNGEHQRLIVRNTQQALEKTNKIVAAHNSNDLVEVIQLLVIPEFKLEQATLREAVTKLGQATIAHDYRDQADNSKGVKFVIDEQSIRKTEPEALKTLITVDLRETSTSELLRLITQFVGITYKVETFAVKLVPLPKQVHRKVDNMGPSDVFLKGHLKLQECRRLEDQQDYKAASLRLAEAIELYDSIARNWPEWQKEMVEKRRQKLRQDLTHLKVKALASRETVPAAINNEGRGFLEVADSSWSDDDIDINPQTPEEERDANKAEMRRWEAMKRHVAELIIPEFSVKSVTLKDAIEKLETLSVTHDKRDVPKDRRGVNILIDERKIKRSNAKSLTKTFSIQADQAPIKTLLDYIMELTDLQYRVEPYAVVIIPSQDTPPTLIEEPPAVDHSEKFERKKDTGGPSTSMSRTMDQITIPSFNHYVTLEEAVSLLEKAAKAHDRRDLPEAQKGIKFSIDKKGFAQKSPELLTRKVNHNYWDSPLSDLLELVCGPSATYKAVDGQIMVIPSLVSSRPRTDLFTKRYHYDLPSRHRKDGAKTALEKAGILFSKESTAFFIPSKNELVVRLPKEQLKLVDAWVNALK